MTTPYANTAIATAQIALAAGVASKAGTGGSGVPLANRLSWTGLSLDSNAQLFYGPVGVTVATGFPMMSGVPEELFYGPAIDIYVISASATLLYVKEVSG
jgi:hypothetical protein